MMSRGRLVPCRIYREIFDKGLRITSQGFRHCHATVHALNMVHAFRNRGHFAATLDPLSQIYNDTNGYGTKLRNSSWLPSDISVHPDVCRSLARTPFDLEPFQLHKISPEKLIDLGDEFSFNGKCQWTAVQLIEFLRNIYCGSVGVEFAHIENGMSPLRSNAVINFVWLQSITLMYQRCSENGWRKRSRGSMGRENGLSLQEWNKRLYWRD